MKAFIIFRDRTRYAQLCLSALLDAGLEPVVIDQGSSWVTALTWLSGLERDGIRVLRRDGGHPYGIWSWRPFWDAAGTADRYIVTDCDVVPAEKCPPDWPARLAILLDANPHHYKAGLGLRTDDIPAHYQRRDHVIEWEGQFRQNPVADGVYEAILDTTMAMYRPLGEHPAYAQGPALRTGVPYVADHLAWHEDLDHLDDELAYYHEHAEPGISYWTTPGRSAWGT